VLFRSVWVAIGVAWGHATASSSFPLRQAYPTTTPISTEDLTAQFGKSIVVDVRSALEYGVIHIKDAFQMPVAKATFAGQLGETTKGRKDTSVVFYCNGHTCAKSYKAAVRAMEMGYTNTLVYDAGIFEWTKTNPDKSWLLGESPVDTNKLLPDSALDAHMLNKAAFAEMAGKEKTFLIDARDPIQIKKTPDFGAKAANLPFDRLTANLTNAHFKNRVAGKTLLIYDAVGKQVQWLQYHLKNKGYEDYYFLEHGVWAVFGEEGAN
jgi:rhodanese-related sulfurtransferase